MADGRLHEEGAVIGVVQRGRPGRGPAMVVLVVLMVFAVLGGGRGTLARQEDAAAVLEQSAREMAGLSSFHFELSTPRGKTVVLENLEVIRLEGDVQRPDSFRASIEARAVVLDVSVDVIGIGSRLWVSDPTAGDGSYFELEMGNGDGGTDSSPADVINPDRLLLRAVELIETPTVGGRDEIDGVSVTRIDGYFDPASVTGDGTPPAALTEQPLPLAIWIDDEGRVRRLEIAGPLTEVEAPDVVRRLDLSAFDEPVVIEAPVAGSRESGVSSL